MPTGKPKLTEAQKAEIKKRHSDAKDAVAAMDLDTKLVAMKAMLASFKDAEGYQRKKVIGTIYENLDAGLKSMLMDELIDHWATQLPKKAREFEGVDDSLKLSQKINWLEEHWGTSFTTGSGKTALRKMPTEQVVELLLTFVLNISTGENDEINFGALDDGSELAEKVADSLRRMSDAVGEEVVITRGAFNELQRLKRLLKEVDESKLRDVDTRLVDIIGKVMNSMPSVLMEKEQAKIDAARAKRAAKKAVDGVDVKGFTANEGTKQEA